MPETKILFSKNIADKQKNQFSKINYHPLNNNSINTLLINLQIISCKIVNTINNVIDEEMVNFAKLILDFTDISKGFKVTGNSNKIEKIKVSEKPSFSISGYYNFYVAVNNQIKSSGIPLYNKSICYIKGNHIEDILFITEEEIKAIKTSIIQQEYNNICQTNEDLNNKNINNGSSIELIIEKNLFNKIATFVHSVDIGKSIESCNKNETLLISTSQDFVNIRNQRKQEFEQKLNYLSQLIIKKTIELSRRFRNSGFKPSDSHTENVLKLSNLSMKFAQVEKQYKDLTGDLTFYEDLRTRTDKEVRKSNLGKISINKNENAQDGAYIISANLYFGDFDYTSEEYTSTLI